MTGVLERETLPMTIARSTISVAIDAHSQRDVVYQRHGVSNCARAELLNGATRSIASSSRVRLCGLSDTAASIRIATVTRHPFSKEILNHTTTFEHGRLTTLEHCFSHCTFQQAKT